MLLTLFFSINVWGFCDVRRTSLGKQFKINLTVLVLYMIQDNGLPINSVLLFS